MINPQDDGPRCEITGNPCGKDVWNEVPCACLPCQRWTVASMKKLKVHADTVDTANQTLENMTSELSRKLSGMKQTETINVWWDVFVQRLGNSLLTASTSKEGMVEIINNIRTSDSLGSLYSKLGQKHGVT